MSNVSEGRGSDNSNSNSNNKNRNKNKTKTIAEINKKIRDGDVVVMSAEELCKIVRGGGGEEIGVNDVDVVTSATCGLMSGIAAILSFTAAPRGTFRKAKQIRLNGVPAVPGPAPNESLGVIDTIVYGTSQSVNDSRYGGGHLFRDLVEGNEVEVEVETSDGKTIICTVSQADFNYARLIATRNAFKNYMGFLNPKDDEVNTIFHVMGMRGPYKEFTFSGCGELNPLEKDPQFEVIGIGTRCLINGAVGYITGTGTRSTMEKPSLSAFADMVDMKPKFMGGFVTAAGPESIVSWAVPIPILNDRILQNVKRLDEMIELPIADIHDRTPIAATTYSKVWQDVDLNVTFRKKICDGFKARCIGKNNGMCQVEAICPTNAFSFADKGIDKSLCFNCGACVGVCPYDAFYGRLGSVRVDDREIPVAVRQSNRARALEISGELKNRVKTGVFLLTEPIEKVGVSKKNR